MLVDPVLLVETGQVGAWARACVHLATSAAGAARRRFPAFCCCHSNRHLQPTSLFLSPTCLQSYERASIEAWFRRCAADKLPCTDPLTHTQLRSPALAPNYALKSLVAGWAERQRIADLPSFSKAVARQRTVTRRGPGVAASTVAEVAAAAAAAALAGMHLGGIGGTGSGRDPASHQQQQQQQQPPPALYPSLQHPPAVASMQAQAETALAALLAAATQRGGSSRGGGSSYHAWTIKQLAGDAQGRQLLWQVRPEPAAG
jgi:hypothetical protein